MRTSVVVITRNSEVYMEDLLDSLTNQALRPLEVLVVDCDSTDRTRNITEKYSSRYPYVNYINRPGTRGYSRNAGAREAKGEFLAFIDSDAIANANWVRELESAFDQGHDVIAGREVRLGYEGWTRLKRVGLYHKGQDISYPSVNLAFRKDLFWKINGFDTWFKDAEDMDLNYRAVDAGASIHFSHGAVVYHRARESVRFFFRQAFWYGFGRKELTVKHGSLWSGYSILDMVKIEDGESFWKILRLVAATMGYVVCKFTKASVETKRKWRQHEMKSWGKNSKRGKGGGSSNMPNGKGHVSKGRKGDS